MNFACEKCQRRYSIADEKIRDRAVKIRCKACQHLMSVGPLPAPEPEPEPEQEEGAAKEDATRMVSLDALEVLRAQTKSPSPSPAPAAARPQNPWDDEPTRAAVAADPGALWFVSSHGKQIGPFATDALGEKIRAGEIQGRNFVWKKGMTDWKRAVELPELAGIFSTSVAAPPPPPPPAPELPFDAPAQGGAGMGFNRAGAATAAADWSAGADPGTGSDSGDAGGYDAGAQPAQRDLDAQDLFSDLELSKVMRAPPGDLSDLNQVASHQDFSSDPSDLPANQGAEPPAEGAVAPAPERRPAHTPHRGTVAMTAGPQRSIWKGLLATLLVLIALIGGLATLVHERIIPVPPEVQEPIDTYWPIKGKPPRGPPPPPETSDKRPSSAPPAVPAADGTPGTPTAPAAPLPGAEKEAARTGSPPPVPAPPATPPKDPATR